MSETERNKRLIRALLAAADAGDLETLAASYSADYVDHDASEARGRGASPYQGLQEAFRRFREAMPDTRHAIHDLIAEGDRVVARISAEGTHTGELFGLPPTGRRVGSESIVIYRVAEGKIVERWCREDRNVLQQLRE